VNCVSDFLCVGAQKGGTTTLRAYLNHHPQLCVPADEVHFFDNDALDWQNPDYQGYWRSLCPEHVPSLTIKKGLIDRWRPKAVGEVTPIYMYWMECAERIYRYNPGMKLIFLLRNPMARAYSHWSMESCRGSESLSFSVCIREEPLRICATLQKQHRVFSYVDRGRYFEQIRRLLHFFDLKQMLFLSSEEFFFDPRSGLRKITDFLGIDAYEDCSVIHRRMGSYRQGPSVLDWSYAYDQLKGDIDQLEYLLKWDLSHWRVPWGGVRA
jgi:hypothetical protein